MSETVAQLGRNWRFWGLVFLLAAIHFLIATGCGLWGLSITRQEFATESSMADGKILITISKVLLFPLYHLMDLKGFRSFVETFLPGPLGHLLAFGLSLCWGFLLAIAAWRIWERRTRRPRA